ncbi:hypothetical protein DSO57_1020713 [Entomophthora muscae]|uniref:Uncharacterized protein n=1 Tax=Entomophthora muscae TaxID=34485 RepID=A0ACC2TF20_9FUNG|nr:hypothetical protein DSO57_1020713 [Entomophthora muscae]
MPPLPFATEIYFKKGSLNERKWNERQALLGGATPEEVSAEASEEVPNETTDEKDIFSSEYSANSRITEADLKKDYKSLERSLENHLYLIVKTKNPKGESVWEFPSGSLKEGENLYQSSRRELDERLGTNLDYWQVGISPIGHFVNQAKTVFFMKTILLGGQVEPASPEITDFAWLNLYELENYLTPEYYENAKEILSL